MRSCRLSPVVMMTTITLSCEESQQTGINRSSSTTTNMPREWKAKAFNHLRPRRRENRRRAVTAG